jgi:TonB family protein
LKEFINDNLVYPDAARKEGLAGSVDVRFTINKEGKVEDIKVMKGISNECDAEALRLIYLMTGWIPGKRQGKPVNTIVYMPIEFKGDKKSNPLIIKGKVVEKNTGLPVEGALIIVKGTNIGSVTGIDGSYKLELPPQSNFLECQGMGYSPEEVSIDYHSTINIELETEYTVIDLSYN